MMRLKLGYGIRWFYVRGQDNCRCGFRNVNIDSSKIGWWTLFFPWHHDMVKMGKFSFQ